MRPRNGHLSRPSRVARPAPTASNPPRRWLRDIATYHVGTDTAGRFPTTNLGIHFTANDNTDLIHLRLVGDHYSPYTVRNYGIMKIEVVNTSKSDLNESRPLRTTVLPRYLAARAILPIAANAAEVEHTFIATEMLEDHPFAHNVNLVHLFSADNYLETKVLGALIERQYFSEN